MLRPEGARRRFDNAGRLRYTDLMSPRLRLLLIVFVLVGATVSIGFSLDDDADLLMLQAPARTPSVDPLEKASSPVGRCRLPRTDSEVTSSLGVSVISLVSVLRC